MPDFVVQFMLRVMAPFMYYIITHLLKRSFKDPEGDLPRRLQQRPELYGLLRQRVDRFLRTKR